MPRNEAEGGDLTPQSNATPAPLSGEPRYPPQSFSQKMTAPPQGGSRKMEIQINLRNRFIFSQDNVTEAKLYRAYREPKVAKYCGKINYFAISLWWRILTPRITAPVKNTPATRMAEIVIHTASGKYGVAGSIKGSL